MALTALSFQALPPQEDCAHIWKRKTEQMITLLQVIKRSILHVQQARTGFFKVTPNLPGCLPEKNS